jgi:hypothetical protein
MTKLQDKKVMQSTKNNIQNQQLAPMGEAVSLLIPEVN